MSSSKSPSRPRPPKVDLEELEARRAQWIEEATVERDNAIQDTIARMAASGLRKDSGLWKTNLQKIEDDYQARLNEIEESATVALINQETSRRELQKKIRNQLIRSGEMMRSARSELSFLSENIGARPRRVISGGRLISASTSPVTDRESRILELQKFLGSTGSMQEVGPERRNKRGMRNFGGIQRTGSSGGNL